MLACASWGWLLGQAAPSLFVAGGVGGKSITTELQTCLWAELGAIQLGAKERAVGQMPGLGGWVGGPGHLKNSGGAWPEPGVSVSLASVEGWAPAICLPILRGITRTKQHVWACE